MPLCVSCSASVDKELLRYGADGRRISQHKLWRRVFFSNICRHFPSDALILSDRSSYFLICNDMMNVAPADFAETHPINLSLFKFVPDLRAGQLVPSLLNTKSTILDPKFVIHKLVSLSCAATVSFIMRFA